MATQPGSPAAAMPASEDTLVRRFADLERFVRELGPSIARSFNGTVADLRKAQEDLETAQGTLEEQVAILASFDTYQNSAVGDFLVNNSSALTALKDVSVTFTLERDCTALVQALGEVGVGVTGTGTAFDISAWVRCNLIIDGAYPGPAGIAEIGGAHSGQAASTNIRATMPLMITRTVQFTAGEHTVMGSWVGKLSTTVGGAGITDPRVIVTVLGTLPA